MYDYTILSLKTQEQVQALHYFTHATIYSHIFLFVNNPVSESDNPKVLLLHRIRKGSKCAIITYLLPWAFNISMSKNQIKSNLIIRLSNNQFTSYLLTASSEIVTTHSLFSLSHHQS